MGVKILLALLLSALTTVQPAWTAPVALLTDRELIPALHQAIRSAREEVVVGMFLFHADGPPSTQPRQLVELLGEAATRGVEVRVVLETTNSQSDKLVSANHHTAKLLRDQGVTVLFDDPQHRSHGKFVVVDGKTCIIGSHNWTQSAFEHNHEVSVRIDDREIARQLLDYTAGLVVEDPRHPDRP